MLVSLPAPSERGLPGWACGARGHPGEPAWLGSVEAACFAGVTVPDAGLALSPAAATSASILLR